MSNGALFLFKNYVEHVPKEAITEFVPELVRGVYVLFQHDSASDAMNVVYIGCSAKGVTRGIGSRLLDHRRDKQDWSHFSVFEVWDNLQDAVIEELESMILLIYARDWHANLLNIQRESAIFRDIRRTDRNSWKHRT